MCIYTQVSVTASSYCGGMHINPKIEMAKRSCMM